MTAAWFSIPDLCARWSCGRTTVYKAIREMEQGGYLKPLFLGKSDQRVALESVETWERLHAAPEGEQPRAAVVTLRERNARKPRPRSNTAPTQRARLRDLLKAS